MVVLVTDDLAHILTHSHIHSFQTGDVRSRDGEMVCGPYVPCGGQRSREGKRSRKMREKIKEEDEEGEEERGSPESDMSSQYGASNS